MLLRFCTINVGDFYTCNTLALSTQPKAKRLLVLHLPKCCAISTPMKPQKTKKPRQKKKPKNHWA